MKTTTPPRPNTWVSPPVSQYWRSLLDERWNMFTDLQPSPVVSDSTLCEKSWPGLWMLVIQDRTTPFWYFVVHKNVTEDLDLMWFDLDYSLVCIFPTRAILNCTYSNQLEKQVQVRFLCQKHLLIKHLWYFFLLVTHKLFVLALLTFKLVIKNYEITQLSAIWDFLKKVTTVAACGRVEELFPGLGCVGFTTLITDKWTELILSPVLTWLNWTSS